MERIEEPWILVQDGDEVFHTDGPQNIESLRHFMDRENVLICTPMIALMGDLLHVDPELPMMPPHPFLYHNNGTLRASKSTPKPWQGYDLPVMDGWKIGLPKPYKFNCKIKGRRSTNTSIYPLYDETKYGSYPEVIRRYLVDSKK